MKISQQLAALTICAVTIIALVAASAYYCVAQLTASHKAVYNSASTLESIQAVCFHLAYASAAQRAYVITGRDTALDLYRNEVETTKDMQLRLNGLVQENPVQRTLVEKLERDVTERLANLETTIQTYEQKGQDAAFDRIKRGVGVTIMARTIQEADALRDNEMTQMIERKKLADVNASNTEMTVLLGSTLAAVIVIISNLFFSSNLSTAVRNLLRASQNVARDRFESLVHVPGNNELADLGRAFNTLSGHLKDKSEQLDKANSRLHIAEEGLVRKTKELDAVYSQLTELTGFVGECSDELGLSIEHHKKFEEDLRDSISLADMTGNSLRQVLDFAREITVAAETVNRRCANLTENVDQFTQQSDQVTRSVDTVWNCIPEAKDLVGQLESLDSELSIIDLVSAMGDAKGESSTAELGVLHERLKFLRKSLNATRSNLNITLNRMQQTLKESLDAASQFNSSLKGTSRPLTSIGNDTKQLLQSTLGSQSELVNLDRLHQRQVVHLDELTKLLTLLDVSITRERDFALKMKLRTTSLLASANANSNDGAESKHYAAIG